MKSRVQRYAVLFFVITLRQPLLMLLLLPRLPMQALIYKCFYFSKLCNSELWCSMKKKHGTIIVRDYMFIGALPVHR